MLSEALEILAQKHPSIRFVRSVGLLAALEVDGGRDAMRAAREALERAKIHLHVRGVALADPPSFTVIISPPLVIDEAELRDGIARLEHALFS